MYCKQMCLFFCILITTFLLSCRRLHCKSNSLHINLFMAFICRAVISFVKESVFVQGVGLEKDVLTLPDGVVEFNPDGTVRSSCFIV